MSLAVILSCIYGKIGERMREVPVMVRLTSIASISLWWMGPPQTAVQRYAGRPYGEIRTGVCSRISQALELWMRTKL